MTNYIKQNLILYLSSLAFLLLVSCNTIHKLNKIKNQTLSVEISSYQDELREYSKIYSQNNILDTTHTSSIDAGTEAKDGVLLMNLVKDQQTGEMVITEKLKEIIIEAKFRNIAERNGNIDIAFNIIVPKDMQDENWQLRFNPILYFLGDSVKLDKILITGAKYRRSQLKGYELYNNFLKSIIPDTCDFIHSFCYEKQLNIFIDRNFKKLARLRNSDKIIDSTYAKTVFGISEKQAIEHYTKNWLVNKNNRRKLSKDIMYKKYIKSPIISDGIRLDSVISSSNGSISYKYIQTIKARENLRKILMCLDGQIYKQETKIYTMPRTDALTFYISSMTAFIENNPRYLTKIIERKANVNTSAFIDFEVGKWSLNDTLSHNEDEIARIKDNIMQIIENKTFIMDSLILSSSCSPEGSYKFNLELAEKRVKSIKTYFSSFIKYKRDSIKNSIWNLDLNSKTNIKSSLRKKSKNENVIEEEIPIEQLIKTNSVAENWSKFQKMIELDSDLQSKNYLLQCFSINDLDEREAAIAKSKDYLYLRKYVYPYLRTVSFNFYLHRSGMVKDTVHTTVLDSTYMQGVKALKEYDYKTAITLLRPYNDFNTALAYLCLDYNNSALNILNNLKDSAKKDYLLAVIKARAGEELRSIEYLSRSVKQDPAMRFRANLDPEIQMLIKKYHLLL